MIFAILFIVAFLFGFASYAFTKQWVISVSLPTALFIIGVFWGESTKGTIAFTLTFGLPLVFFAGLLGAYVFQIRNQPIEELLDETVDETKQTEKDD